MSSISAFLLKPLQNDDQLKSKLQNQKNVISFLLAAISKRFKLEIQKWAHFVCLFKICPYLTNILRFKLLRNEVLEIENLFGWQFLLPQL
jgi:hypothetical protein